jgi:SAM-dependent methyltransferase
MASAMTTPASNTYSSRWFEFFHAGIGDERTNREIEFICAMAPLPDFREVLDVCCGMGRHARALAARGYSVTGIERDPGAIARANVLGGGPEYLQADVRDYPPDRSACDLAIVMSQSFGYFDAAGNRDLLRRLATGVRNGGRIILDLWNPDFFASYQGERDLELAGGVVRETKTVKDSRLFVRLDYPAGGRDAFEWQLFTPSELRSLADSVGLVLVTACTGFDAAMEPSAENPRLQCVLEKVGSRK